MYRAAPSRFASDAAEEFFNLAALKEMNEEPPEAFKENHCAQKNQDQRLLLQKKLQKYDI